MICKNENLLVNRKHFPCFFPLPWRDFSSVLQSRSFSSVNLIQKKNVLVVFLSWEIENKWKWIEKKTIGRKLRENGNKIGKMIGSVHCDPATTNSNEEKLQTFHKPLSCRPLNQYYGNKHPENPKIWNFSFLPK